MEEFVVIEEDENEGNEVLENDLDENSEKVLIIEWEDENEILILLFFLLVYLFFCDINVKCIRENVNFLKKELNFVISRFIFEVIMLYE